MERLVRLFVGVVLLAAVLTAFLHIYHTTPKTGPLSGWERFNLWTFAVAIGYLITTRVIDDWRDTHHGGPQG